MKKANILVMLLAACVLLSGCVQMPPGKAADGLDWNDSWVTLGYVLGVDTPEGLTHREYNDTLSTSGMYYATWSMGEAVPFVNAEGEDATLYDAQVYVLLAGSDSAEKAEGTLDSWLEMAKEQYHIQQTTTQVCNGQTFTVMTYTYDSDTNPYAFGASAFGVYRNYAISVELSCQEDLSEDPQEILLDFLNHCHYGT